jgi:AraC-like DNA-binding protein
MQLVVPPSAPQLAPFVESLWYVQGARPPGRELVLPSGAMQLLVNLDADELRAYHGARVQEVSGAALQGVRSGATEIDSGQLRAMAGVAFRPGGAFPFTVSPSSATVDELVGLDELWGRDGAVLRDRLLSAPTPHAVLSTLEAVLLARAVRPLGPDPVTAFALSAFERGASVAAVTERLGMTSKRFGRLFLEQVGLTPKRFSRVRRFQRLLGLVTSDAEVDWASRAVESGYYDQSHLIHEFRELSGLRPTEYRPRSPGERNHVALPA